ncbi:MAG TPA: histidinol-phosphate transaminase [Bacteroidota bacterium]|nr:histidinol-phosphate transaminase [Bacteroidota bacterium]
MSQLVRPALEGITEYTLRQYDWRIKLNQNENPFEIPAQVKQEILDRVGRQPWSRYPPFDPRRQRERLAAFTGWTADGILLGNGSNDLLQLLFLSVLDGSRSLVISQPTFTLYKLLGQSLGASVNEVFMKRPFAFDVEALVETTNRTRAAMIVICSPNNPTGTQLSLNEVQRILDATEALVVLDEAYVHFSGASATSLLSRYDRLVLLQTFSKAMGAAGLRFGYALLAPELARQLDKAKLPYAVNIFTLTAAEVLMDRWEELKPWIGTLIAERKRVYDALTQIDAIHVSESMANFLLFESLRKPPREIFEGLLRRGILIRDVSSYPMLGRALRVSIGTPGENDEFLNTLRELQ